AENGNFSFGVPEYIDIPKVEYDPKLGIMGLDVCVKLGRAGNRITRRKLHNAKVPMGHRLTKEESIEFMKTNFNVNIE
ncbi:MAG: 50S ribosomal protein L5, partial [Candidatus Diapherotrites archaeon]|nr:50S ribosomal protein L5 [Candidatus Diapherotrites archaeon]